MTSPQHSAAAKPLSSGPCPMVGMTSGWEEAWLPVLKSDDGFGSMKPGGFRQGVVLGCAMEELRAKDVGWDEERRG